MNSQLQVVQVQLILDRLGLSVVRSANSSQHGRYFRAVVTRNTIGDHRRYFLKVGFATPLVMELLDHELRVSSMLNASSLPSVRLIDHNLEEHDAPFRYGLFEFLEANGPGGFAERDGKNLQPWHARALVDTLSHLRAIPAAQVRSLSTRMDHASITFSEWRRRIVARLQRPVAPDAGADRPYATLGDALRTPNGKPFVDDLLELVAGFEPVYLRDSPGFLVHGDCAPSNTFWRDDQVAVLLDWEWANVALSPWDLPSWGRDFANFYTRAWRNPEVQATLLNEYLERNVRTDFHQLAIRASLVEQTLNKLGPYYAYTENHWRGNLGAARFAATRNTLCATVLNQLW